MTERPSDVYRAALALGVLAVALPNQFALFVLLQPHVDFRFALRPLSLGYGEQGIYIALGDVLLLLTFAGWLIWTMRCRLWKDVSLPPFSLFALWAVAALSVLNASGIWKSLSESIADNGFAIGSLIDATSFRGAATEMIQWTLYFILAPILFINLLRMQGHTGWLLRLILLVTLISGFVAVCDIFVRDDGMPVRGLWGSLPIYIGVLAILLPIAAARLQRGTRAKRRWLPEAVLLLGIVTIVVGVAKAGPSKFLSIYDEEGDVKKEFIEWGAGINLLTSKVPRTNLPLGVGMGNYQNNIGSYYGPLPNKGTVRNDVNSLFWVLAGSTGFIGLTAFIFTLLQFGEIARRVARAQGGRATRALAVGMQVAIVSIAVISPFTNILVRGSAPLLILLFCMLHDADLRVSRKNKSQATL